MIGDLQPCSVCRQCNHIGKPSVMRGSAYCDSHKQQGRIIARVGLFQRFKDRLFERYYDKKENQMKPSRGFRLSWFWRN